MPTTLVWARGRCKSGYRRIEKLVAGAEDTFIIHMQVGGEINRSLASLQRDGRERPLAEMFGCYWTRTKWVDWVDSDEMSKCWCAIPIIRFGTDERNFDITQIVLALL